MTACSACGCTATTHPLAHAIAAALVEDDLDAALDAGLLHTGPCPACAPACQEQLRQARAGRERALAARERHRAREARLARRAEARAAARPSAAAAPGAARPDGRSDAGPPPGPVLPPAAAAALARARARAAGRTR